MRECREHEITVEKFLKVVHYNTECIKIQAVCNDRKAYEDKMRQNFYITENASETEQEMERVLRYYKDVPVWNLHVEFEPVYDFKTKGQKIVISIVANCHYADIREGYLAEREDTRRQKRREYYQRKKNEETGNGK